MVATKKGVTELWGPPSHFYGAVLKKNPGVIKTSRGRNSNVGFVNQKMNTMGKRRKHKTKPKEIRSTS